MDDLKLIQAQLAYLLIRLEKLEYRVKGGLRSASVQSYVDELKKEAAKIVDQIR
jgi:hypothetical protein